MNVEMNALGEKCGVIDYFCGESVEIALYMLEQVLEMNPYNATDLLVSFGGNVLWLPI